VSVLKSQQSGQVTLLNESVSVTVASYVAANSILFFSFKGGNSDARRSFVRGEKTDSTTITFYKGNSGETYAEIAWGLYEFDGNTDVQDITESGTGTQNTTITSVDMDLAHVMPLGVSNATDTSKTDTYTAALEVTSATNVQRRAGSSGSSATFAYQVVQQEGDHGTNSVQFFSRSADTGTSFNQTISSVTTSRTAIFGSGKCNASSWGYGDQFRIKLTSGTNVQGNRAGSASWDSAFYVVEYKLNVKVQTGTFSFSGSGTDQSTTVTSVVTKNAGAQTTAATCMGFSMGTHSYAAEANGVNINTRVALTSATNLNFQRSGGYDTLSLDWQVLEADPNATSIVQVNDTPTEADGADGVSFSHTIGGNSDRILIVCVTTRGNSEADTAVLCTYNAVSMTQGVTKVSNTGGFNLRTTIFYMLEANLPSAGSYTVSVTTPTGTSQETQACAYSVRDAAQQAPDATATDGADASTNFVDTDITTTVPNTFIVDCFAGDGSISDTTARTGQTERGEIPDTQTTLLTSTRPAGLAEAWPMAWDFGSSFNRWAHAVLALAPVSQLIDLEGDSDGSSSVAGSLAVDTALEADSDGVATVAASLGVIREIEGESDGVASVVGTLLVDLVGHADGVSVVSGSLDVLTALEGESDGVADVAGSLDVPKGLAGQIDGSSVVSAYLNILEEILQLQGQADGSSSVECLGSEFKVRTRLLVGVPGQATVTGTLAPDRVLQGESDGVATVAGTLDVAGQADGVADVSGSLGVLTLLAGQADGAASVAGSLYGAIRLIEAAVAGQASVSGSLEVATSLASLVSGEAAVEGSLAVQTALAALVDGVADVTATLQKTRPVEGQADGVATVAGTLAVLTALEGQADGVADVAGTVNVLTALRAAVAGVATVAASLEQDVPIEGQADGVATVLGALNVLRALEAAADGVSAVEATLGKRIPVEGQADGVATVSADMLNFVWQNGQADGEATVVSALEVLTALEAAVAGQSVPTGALEVAVALIGESLGLSTPVGTLSIDGLGLGPAIARGRARVSGELSVVRFISSHSGKEDPRIITRTI
jgi:hypothetical protein